jgi:hypothetical protein
VLAELLGISITVATRWTAIVGSDNADYLAARRESPYRELNPHRQM